MWGLVYLFLGDKRKGKRREENQRPYRNVTDPLIKTKGTLETEDTKFKDTKKRSLHTSTKSCIPQNFPFSKNVGARDLKLSDFPHVPADSPGLSVSAP